MSRRYRLRVSILEIEEAPGFNEAEFDVVIIATPLESARLDFNDFSLYKTDLPLPWIDTHITHFSTPVAIPANLSAFALDVSIFDGWTLTSSTLGEPNILNVHRFHVCLRRYCLPGDECDECDEDEILYRMHSREYVADSDMVRLVGGDLANDKELDNYGIHLERRKIWPRSQPQVIKGGIEIVDDVEIAPNLYFLNSAENVISSMETSCRMARNAANLIKVKRWEF